MQKSWRTNYHILLVEDNSGDELLFKDVLSRSRFNTSCDTVTNGEDALDYLYKKGCYQSARKPDLVLMDLTLPRMNGFDLLKIIKEDPELRSVPIVIFTGSDAPSDIQKAYGNGANGYLKKPIGIKELEEKVKNLEEFWFDTIIIPSKIDS